MALPPPKGKVMLFQHSDKLVKTLTKRHIVFSVNVWRGAGRRKTQLPDRQRLMMGSRRTPTVDGDGDRLSAKPG